MKTRQRVFSGLLIVASAATAADAPRPAGTDWEVAGTLGLLQFIVVQGPRTRDRAFYDEITRARCAPDATCFLRFYTNSGKAPLAMPLPEAIEKEPAAMFQRSAKQGNAMFQWSCRMGVTVGNCF